MSFTSIERETIINISDEDNMWDVYTRQGKIMTKLKNIGAVPYKVERDENNRIESAWYKLNYKQVSFRKDIILSEEQKEKRRLHMEQVRQNQK
jgi:transcription initiation factor IIE alpha subunit